MMLVDTGLTTAHKSLIANAFPSGREVRYFLSGSKSSALDERINQTSKFGAEIIL
jgi:hypothetical protein